MTGLVEVMAWGRDPKPVTNQPPNQPQQTPPPKKTLPPAPPKK